MVLYVSEKVKDLSLLQKKSVSVNITNKSTGITKTYDSFRKAALSFYPRYTTNGSTLKSYAESGKLFKNEYKISVSTMINKN